MTSGRSAADARDATGEVFDLGYRPYEGDREGRGLALRGVQHLQIIKLALRRLQCPSPAKVCIFIQYWMDLQGWLEKFLQSGRQRSRRLEMHHVACSIYYEASAIRKWQRLAVLAQYIAECLQDVACCPGDKQHGRRHVAPAGLGLGTSVEHSIREFVCRIGAQLQPVLPLSCPRFRNKARLCHRHMRTAPQDMSCQRIEILKRTECR